MKISSLIAGGLILVLVTASLYFFISPKSTLKTISIHPAEYYPRWLMNDLYHPSQTSGITFIRNRADGVKEFLLADDIGKIHRLTITEDTLFSFSEMKFSDRVESYLSDFPKPDFEEIFYDKFSGKVYITIEGNGDNHLEYHGIFELVFKDNNIYQDSIIALTKLQFKPEKFFYSNLRPNIGYEGFTADEKYFYLGLENEQTSEGNFSEQTIIRIADKQSLTIVKEISTKDLNISTACGLYSDENFSLWGVDRNHKRLFKLLLDEYLNIVDLELFEIKSVIPFYSHLEYVGSLESITLAPDKFLFLVDDPWHTFFIPPSDVLEKIDTNSVNNFKNFIPVIYKFVVESN
jgi:hypothetical protein